MTARWGVDAREAALKWPELDARAIRATGDPTLRHTYMTAALLDADVLLEQGMKGVAMDVVIQAARAYREATA